MKYAILTQIQTAIKDMYLFSRWRCPALSVGMPWFFSRWWRPPLSVAIAFFSRLRHPPLSVAIAFFFKIAASTFKCRYSLGLFPRLRRPASSVAIALVYFPDGSVHLQVSVRIALVYFQDGGINLKVSLQPWFIFLTALSTFKFPYSLGLFSGRRHQP